MKYVKLGTTGLDVSAIALGCMSYGEPERGNHGWTLPEVESRPFIKQAIEAGITFFDTANSYSDGTSEEILGRAVQEYARRDEIVIATKVWGQMRRGPNGRGLSRKAIMKEVDDSLRRLGTDYVDLYQIHRFDPHTPLEETLGALDDIVRAGKALYIGASSMYAWQFAKALHLQRQNGWARFVSMQSQYSLIVREDEREMFPLCLDEAIGAIPWSPLGRGKLTRDWGIETARTKSDEIAQNFYKQAEASDHQIVDAVRAIAADRGLPMAQIALAWVLSRPVVSAPIVGATRAQHLEDAVAALDIELTDAEVATLETPYVPRLPETY